MINGTFDKVAKALASKSDHTEFRHSAIIVKGGNILAAGFNKGKKHAEISAIGRDVNSTRLQGSTLYSFRFSNRGLANSRPCNSCFKGIAKAGIKEMIFVIKNRAYSHMRGKEVTWISVVREKIVNGKIQGRKYRGR